jgi:hypothetical protein
MENNGMDSESTQALALSLLLTASVPLLSPGWQTFDDLKPVYYNGKPVLL